MMTFGVQAGLFYLDSSHVAVPVQIFHHCFGAGADAELVVDVLLVRADRIAVGEFEFVEIGYFLTIQPHVLQYEHRRTTIRENGRGVHHHRAFAGGEPKVAGPRGWQSTGSRSEPQQRPMP
jgi:hypothetical protein